MTRNTFLILVGFLSSFSSYAEDKVDFDREIRPILSEYCFHCHGPDSKTREAGLRLDTPEGAFAEEDGVHAIIPGNAAESEIMFRMLDSEDPMPPEKSKLTMKPEEIEKIKQWIDAGAEWAEHWAFVPVEKPSAPPGEMNTIDAFIARRLKEEGLAFSPEPKRETLIRRVTLDLTGLPPTPDEVEAFLEDESLDAYDKVVDRLMASPGYGERMAWDWLDAARYSDTDGFQNDPTRSMWPWRDWLVDALNRNMPFDQFTVEMLAGDLLPNASPSQRLASGFNRNHTYNGEGGRIAEETRVENVFDRTETTSTVWMGLTMTCARCHDHKYDPITQQEYFQLYDFFNQTSESGRGGRGKAPPIMAIKSDEYHRRLAETEKQKQAFYAKRAEPDSAFDKEQADWEHRLKSKPVENAWTFLIPQQVQATNETTFEILEDASFRAGGKNPDHDTYTYFASTSAERIQSLRLETLLDDTQVVKGVGRDTNGNFVMTQFEIFARAKGDEAFQRLTITSAEADHTQRGFSIEHTFDNNPKSAGWAVDGHVKREPRQATFRLKEAFEAKEGIDLKIVMGFHSRYKLHNLARGRFATHPHLIGLKEDPQSIEPAIQQILAIPAAKRNQEQVTKLRVAYRKDYSPNKKDWADQLDKLNKQSKDLTNSVPQVMVMDELPPPKHRKTLILDGGIYDKDLGIEAKANTPAWLPPLAKDLPRNRLGLARWIVDPINPLTARVTINRYWQLFFGRGQVVTTEDFGTQGAKPTHPELLDWLAAEFVESGWNVKALHRLIITSKTYRQSAKLTPALHEKDPANALLARGPRHRLPSWMLRDQALAVSGLLNPEMGGPGVKPYQPDGIWAEATFGKIKYKPDHGDKLYRRSLYVFWRRISGPPMFFDAAKRQTCEVKVARTNTPLHALTTLNEPMFMEAARAMAQRVLGQAPETRLASAFRLATARAPDAVEQEFLAARLTSFLDAYAKAPNEARALLDVGESSRNSSLDPAEHAAWTLLCSTLLNLDETLSKE